MRNGPGRLKIGECEFKHIFDSPALIHRFNLHNGRVTYNCKFVQSKSFERNRIANRIVTTEFGTCQVPDPCHSIFRNISLMFRMELQNSDNASIAIYPFNDELYATTESPFMHRINPETLETEERIDLQKRMGIVCHTSHAIVANDGTYNLGLILKNIKTYYAICHFPLGDKHFDNTKIIATIPTRYTFYPSYMHSFAMTENYFIVVEQPMSISIVTMAAQMIRNKPIVPALQWYDDEQAYIHLIDRNTGKLNQTYESNTFFFMHTINAYETNNHVIFDLCCYKDGSILNDLFVESIRNYKNEKGFIENLKAYAMRFVLPLDKEVNTDEEVFINLVTLHNTNAEAYRKYDKTIICIPETLCDIACEAPRFYDEKYLGNI